MEEVDSENIKARCECILHNLNTNKDQISFAVKISSRKTEGTHCSETCGIVFDLQDQVRSLRKALDNMKKDSSVISSKYNKLLKESMVERVYKK